MQPPVMFVGQQVFEDDPQQFHPPPKRSRKCIDWFTAFLLVLVWVLLLLICFTLLVGAKLATLRESDASLLATPDEVGLTSTLVALPVLFCLICNEALLDRSWRRIHYFAMGRRRERSTDMQCADNLRAANFNIFDFFCRLLCCRASLREWTSAVSYVLLRFGTVVSIASAQYCVSWRPGPDGYYYVHKRYIWIFVPVVSHAVSIFGPFLLWRRWPCVFFSDRFSDEGLRKKYKHTSDRIRGSLATYKEIADALEAGYTNDFGQHMPVRCRVRTGRQILAKLNGVAFGLLTMLIPPLLAWRLNLSHHVLTLGEYRFIFTLVFTLQNVLYLQAVDFAIWNITLDGFCRSPRAVPNKTMRYLGYSSGIVLFAKICKQRRPLRAAIHLWLFWISACLMRFLLVLYTLCVTFLSYYSLDDMSDVLDPRFWIGWLVITVPISLLPFIIWICMKVEAPVGPVDGWRWAQIANEAVYSDGFYGIHSERARWGNEVPAFTGFAGQDYAIHESRACWGNNVSSFTEFEGQEVV